MKAFIYKYFGSMFMEEKRGVVGLSLGRVAFMIDFGFMLYHWIFQPEMPLPGGSLEVFYTLCGYNFGTKLSGALKMKLLQKQTARKK